MTLSRRKLLSAAPLVLLPTGRLFGETSEKTAKVFQEFTPESEEAARRGTAWLMKTINRDGGSGVDIGQPSDIGTSAMVGLALMSQGNTPVEGPHSRVVRQILDYLLQQVKLMPPDANDITQAVRTQLQNKIGRHAHSFFAILFLSQVMGEGWEPERIRLATNRLVKAVTSAQTAEGHWGNQSWAPTLGTVMGWVALRGAHFAGFKVDASAKKVADHLIQVMRSKIGHRSGSWMHTFYKNATGIRVLYALGMEEDPVAKKAFADALNTVTKDNTPFSQAGGEEYLAFHLITETMLQKGDPEWSQWYPTVRDKMMDVQNADGSWTGLHCITSRTFCTAAAVLVLSAPNRFLPISQQ